MAAVTCLVVALPAVGARAHGKIAPGGASLLGPNFFDPYFSVGPVAGAMLMLSEHRTTGAATLGVEFSVAERPGKVALRDLNASMGLDAGYAFSDRRGFLDLHVAYGLWLVSAGAVVSPSYGRGGEGLIAGPVLIGHWRLNDGGVQHEIELVARGDVAVLGPTADRFQLTLGLRFLFDLDG
jgi:hypothetical protein